MSNALRFKQSNLPRQAKEVARFKVIHGPDSGVTFVLVGNKVSIGRGEENDVVISDLKSSRLHAILQETEKGFAIKDQASANGIIINGQVVREGFLKSKDQITLGETTLEFVRADAPSRVLSATPNLLSLFPGFKKGMKASKPESKSTKNQINPRVLLLGGALLLFLVYPGQQTLQTGDAEDPKEEGPKSDSKADVPHGDLSSYLPEVQIDKPAEIFYKEGVREYYQGNYSRARTQFETVLQISPGYRLGTIFLEKCNQAILEGVKNNLVNGKRAYSLGKVREARGYFERVMRLLYHDPVNSSYVQARDEIEKINREMNSTGGEQ